jgi:hypothetical protein
MPRRITEEQFWEKFDKSGECWIWKGYINPGGYGNIMYQYKQWTAHRLAYTFAKGPIPEGMYVRHTCDTPACGNPEHLVLGTAKDNAQDKVDRDRCSRVSVSGANHYRWGLSGYKATS